MIDESQSQPLVFGDFPLLSESVRRVVGVDEWVLTTSLDADECAKRLRAKAGWGPAAVFRMPPTAGRVVGLRFELMNTTDLSSRLSPIAFGEIIPTATGTMVRSRVGVKRFVLVPVIGFGIIGVVFWFVAIARLFAGEHPLGSEPLAWIMRMIFIPGMFGWLAMAVWLENAIGNRAKLHAFLCKTLVARDVAPGAADAERS
jgi:hypothetical protein